MFKFIDSKVKVILVSIIIMISGIGLNSFTHFPFKMLTSTQKASAVSKKYKKNHPYIYKKSCKKVKKKRKKLKCRYKKIHQKIYGFPKVSKNIKKRAKKLKFKGLSKRVFYFQIFIYDKWVNYKKYKLPRVKGRSKSKLIHKSIKIPEYFFYAGIDLSIRLYFPKTKSFNVKYSKVGKIISVKNRQNLGTGRNTHDCSIEKCISLTFDDGPGGGDGDSPNASLKNTDKIVNILKKNNIPATFFNVGVNIKENPSELKKEVNYNFVLGNHTNTHRNLSKTSSYIDIFNQICKMNMEQYKVVGFLPNYFRHPYVFTSIVSDKIVAWTGLYVVERDVSTAGWWPYCSFGTNAFGNCYNSTTDLINHTVSSLKNDSILLLHDPYDVEADSFEELLRTLKNLNYVFVSIKDLFYNSGIDKNAEYYCGPNSPNVKNFCKRNFR